MMSFRAAVAKVREAGDLTTTEAKAAFDDIFSGSPLPEEIGTFLLALSKKGETADELLGAVQSMRAHALTIKAPRDAIDIVGTGGDQHQTLNISTAVALVVAACGVPVAKHGNRSVTSRSGSSDVLSALGVNLNIDFERLEECLHETKLCFLFAPRHHPAMKHVSAVRKELGIRTIFNLLGPLTNPANVTKHLIGSYELEWLGPMAEVLKHTGTEHAWLVHGHDGLDEISTTTATDLVEMVPHATKHATLTPEQAGIDRAKLTDLRGGDAVHNASELKKLLAGQKGAYRDIVLLNAAAALIIAGKSPDLMTGVATAAEALDAGAAQNTLDRVILITNRSQT